MYEKEKSFSFTDFFIKAIIVIIFILFTVWLLSLSNKGVSRSINILTDEIFENNIEKMKEVGKNYFTTERLPEKVGEVKTLTLQKMYDKKYLLTLKDKNGKACSASNSYVSIEKMENEYQMKVYLECGKNSDYIIVIMGCYDYCDSDICERKETVEPEEKPVKEIEYEYKRTTGGKWSSYGEWSSWSKTSVTATNSRQVEKKVVSEDYTYDKKVINTDFKDFIISCKSGYTLANDKMSCYKNTTENEYKDYSTICPSTYNGGTFVNKTGDTCNYKVENNSNVDPICPSVSGWTLANRNGFTCSYTRDVKQSYYVTVTSPKTCYRAQLVYPCDSCAPITQQIPYDCSTKSQQLRYKTVTETSVKDATCPDGSNKVDSNCVAKTTKTISMKGTLECPTGYKLTSDKSKCYKETNVTKTDYVVASCPSGYTITSDKSKCYAEIESFEKATKKVNVTYYRYRVRKYIEGTVDYKWSKSKDDKSLISAGYKLTGKTR